MAAESTMNSRWTDGILRINPEFSEKKSETAVEIEIVLIEIRVATNYVGGV